MNTNNIPLTYKRLQGARQGDIPIISLMLEKHPHLLNTPTQGHNRTLLWEAVRFHRSDLVHYLIMRGADPDIPGRYRNETFVLCKPLAIARTRGYDDLVDLLKPKTEQDVFSAAFIDDLAVVRAYCEIEPAIANKRQSEDEIWHVTPLHHAVSGGHLETVNYLIEIGADVTLHSQLLLDIALRRQRGDIVETLLTHGAIAAQAPVFAALQCNSHALFSQLVTQGMDINAKINGQWPPLVYICRGDKGEHPERVQWLLNAGADIRDTAPHAMTALHVAARAGYVRVISLLLEAGANPRAVNDKGQTPYQLAEKAHHDAVLDLLNAAMSRTPSSH